MAPISTPNVLIALVVGTLISTDLNQAADNPHRLGHILDDAKILSAASSYHGHKITNADTSGLQKSLQASREKRQVESYLKALDIKATYFDGQPVAKSSYLDCNTEKSCSFSVTYQHTESVRHAASLGFEMSPVAILKLVAHVSTDKMVSNAVSTAYGITIGPHSRARMMFKPRLVRIKGRVALDRTCIKQTERIIGAILTIGVSEIYNRGTADCDDHKLGPFEIIAPAATQKGNKNDVLDGEWFLEYSDNPLPVDSQNFQNFRDKSLLKLADAYVYEKTVGNPMMCAKLAKDYSYKVAVYYNATCRMKHTTEDFKSYTGDGKFIDDYGIELPFSKDTKQIGEMHDWIENKDCDLIEHDSHNFHCKQFQHKPKSVVMFKKSTTPETNLLDMTEIGDPIQ